MNKDAIISALKDALNDGWTMRNCQREYFRTRTPSALQASKDAERRFDAAIVRAQKVVKHGGNPPEQGTLL